jgi:hypothetical protein
MPAAWWVTSQSLLHFMINLHKRKSSFYRKWWIDV